MPIFQYKKDKAFVGTPFLFNLTMAYDRVVIKHAVRLICGRGIPLDFYNEYIQRQHTHGETGRELTRKVSTDSNNA